MTSQNGWSSRAICFFTSAPFLLLFKCMNLINQSFWVVQAHVLMPEQQEADF
jgi:hypothetical protein